MANKFLMQLILIASIITGLFTAVAITHWVYFSSKDILDGKITWSRVTYGFNKRI